MRSPQPTESQPTPFLILNRRGENSEWWGFESHHEAGSIRAFFQILSLFILWPLSCLVRKNNISRPYLKTLDVARSLSRPNCTSQINGIASPYFVKRFITLQETSCFDYVELTTYLLFWLIPNELNTRSPTLWYFPWHIKWVNILWLQRAVEGPRYAYHSLSLWIKMRLSWIIMFIVMSTETLTWTGICKVGNACFDHCATLLNVKCSFCMLLMKQWMDPEARTGFQWVQNACRPLR